MKGSFTVQSSAELTLGSHLVMAFQGRCRGKGHCLLMNLMLSFKDEHVQVYILSEHDVSVSR